MSNNPLQSYYRVSKMYIRLPSGTSYYRDGVVKFTDNGEVGIKAMTSRDEMMLKNPDALLNGEAFKEVLKSCVDGLADPTALLINDVESLMVAIKQCTYGNNLEFNVNCPKCDSDNKFSMDLTFALSNMQSLDSEYVVTLESGLSLFLRPYSYSDFVKTSLSAFEQNKLIQKIQDTSIPEEERLKLLTRSFDTLTKLNIELMTSTIIKMVKEDDNFVMENNIENRKNIVEFLKNISKEDSDRIQSEVTRMNSVGLVRKMNVICQNKECNHEWEADVDFNPVNFSTGS